MMYHIRISTNLAGCWEKKLFYMTFLDSIVLELFVRASIFCLLSPRNSVGGDIVTRPFVGGWVSEWVGRCVCACVCVSVTLYLVDTIATTVFTQSLSNFTCKLWMMRGGTLLILGHGVKGQGQLWHSMYKTLWAR